jgi:carnosine N-methyltransferase
VSVNKQVEAVTIPDIVPCDLPTGVDFSMVAGEFLEVYGDQTGIYKLSHFLVSFIIEEWDAVATCFFLDTAKNIIDYIHTIHRILRKSGIWINFGPLLFHFEDDGKEPSIEISLEEVLDIVKNFGFEIRERRMIVTTYTNNPGSMLTYTYKCSFFVAVKIK